MSHTNRPRELSGADERGTYAHLEGVSHTHPNENTLYRGLMWDTLAARQGELQRFCNADILIR